MARKNIVKVKKNHTWRFYTVISSIVGALVVATIVVLAVLYIVFNTDTYRNRFEDLTEYKINYDDFDLKVSKDTDSNEMFVFVYNDSFLDEEAIEDLEDTDPVKKEAIAANEALNSFVEAYRKYSETSSDVAFYVINSSLVGNKEDGNIVTNSNYGNIDAPGFIYIHGDKCYETVELKNSGITYSLTGSGSYDELAHTLIEATRYLQNQDWNNAKWN